MNTQQELEQMITELEAEIKRNIEEHAMLHKEKARYKRELWELRGK